MDHPGDSAGDYAESNSIVTSKVMVGERVNDKRPEGAKRPGDRQKKHFGKRSRKWLIATVTAIIVGVVAGIILEETQPWFTKPAAAVDPTQVIFYEPWNTSNPTGNTLSNVRVAHTFVGFCWERSIVTNRSDAYRCISPAHRLLLDPCFANPFLISSNVTQIACPYPSPDSITLFQLTQKLPNLSSPIHKPPYKPTAPSSIWLLVLSDGKSCIAGGATVNVIGGELQNYYDCPGNGFLLYGYPQHTSSVWTILEQKNGSSSITAVPIAKAYY